MSLLPLSPYTYIHIYTCRKVIPHTFRDISLGQADTMAHYTFDRPDENTVAIIKLTHTNARINILSDNTNRSLDTVLTIFLSINTFGLRILIALMNFNEYKYHNSRSIAKIILKINDSDEKSMYHPDVPCNPQCLH